MATKIGIIGDANLGGALARGLERSGHDVRLLLDRWASAIHGSTLPVEDGFQVFEKS